MCIVHIMRRVQKVQLQNLFHGAEGLADLPNLVPSIQNLTLSPQNVFLSIQSRVMSFQILILKPQTLIRRLQGLLLELQNLVLNLIKNDNEHQGESSMESMNLNEIL